MKQIEVTKFNTFENKLIKLNSQLVLLDKDVANLYEIEPKTGQPGQDRSLPRRQ